PLEEGERCKRCTCKWCGSGLSKGFFFIYGSSNGNSSICDPNPNSFIDSQNFSYPPPQPQTYSYEQTANLRTSTSDFLQRFKLIYKGSTIPLNNMPQIYPSIAITPDLPIEEPEDSLIMGDGHLSTIPEKESDEFIKSSVVDLVLIPSESEDTSESDSDCDLPSDDESLSDEDVPKENVKIYSNPLFEFDDEYISSAVNHLFDEVLENIESKESYVSNLDEPALLVTPLSDFNEDECFDPGGDVDEIELLLYRDPSTPTISIVSILEGFIDEPPLEENDDLFDLESKMNDLEENFVQCSNYGYHDSEGDILYLESLLSNDTILSLPPKVFLDHDPRSLSDINDLKIMVKVFDPGIHEKKISPTYVSLTFEDCHYLSFTYVIRIFLPYFTYPVNSSLALSSGSENVIFDPGISAFHFSSLKRVAYEYPMEVCSSTCFVPNITMIWGEIAWILKALVLMILSIVHSIFNPLHAYIWESDILDLID
ncbi:hypothetical protein Tco_0964815, partial [Tanacetum coccineum]